MKYLLDTSVTLWSFLESTRIRKNVLAEIANRKNDVFVSAAATWEIVIKASLRKNVGLPQGQTPERYLPPRIERAGFSLLPITAAHTYAVYDLPLHHADPFDRLLIAQAQVEDLTIVTSDRVFKQYDVAVVMT